MFSQNIHNLNVNIDNIILLHPVAHYMQHFLNNLFKRCYIYTMSLLNLFKTILYTRSFDRQWSSSGVFKLFVETVVLAFCVSNIRYVVPSHIRVSVTCVNNLCVLYTVCVIG
jgi:hypothetical protein